MIHFAVQGTENNPDCVPLSRSTHFLTSFPSIEACSYALKERKYDVNKRARKSKLSFYTAARVIGRFTCILNFIRSSSEFDDENRSEATECEEIIPIKHLKTNVKNLIENKHAHFDVKASRKHIKDSDHSVTQSENKKISSILRTPVKGESLEYSKERILHANQNKKDLLTTKRRKMTETRSFDQILLRRDDEKRRRGYDTLGSYGAKRSFSQDHGYVEDVDFSDRHVNSLTTDSVAHDGYGREKCTQLEFMPHKERNMTRHNYRLNTSYGHSNIRNMQKQVKFSDTVSKVVRFDKNTLFSDSSFSDSNASVEHLYQSPQYAKVNAAAVFNPSESSATESSWRSWRRQEEYIDGSDCSNSCYSQEDIIDEPVKNHMALGRKLQRPKLTPRLLGSNNEMDSEDIIHKPHRNFLQCQHEVTSTSQPLPDENCGMLERYLSYFGIEMKEALPAYDFRPFLQNEAKHVTKIVEVEGRVYL